MDNMYSKKKIWLWIIGWIFIFPIPITIIVRKRVFKNILKFGIICCVWGLYIAGAFISINLNDLSQKSENISETNKTTENDSNKDTVFEHPYVELDKLQKLFIQLPLFDGRDDINNFIKKNNLISHKFTGDKEYYIGMTTESVNPRSRDREGAVIEICYDDEGKVIKAGYTIGGSVGFFENFELVYINRKFHYEGEEYDDGELVMQLYLSNKDVSK